MQHVLQNALGSGFSATEGYHSDKPNKVDPTFDGMEAVLPQSFVPQTSTRITLKGKNDNVQIPWMSIGAWPWGDSATWHWDPKERAGLTDAWELLVENGINCKHWSGLYSLVNHRLTYQISTLPRPTEAARVSAFVVNLSKTCRAKAMLCRQSIMLYLTTS